MLNPQQFGDYTLSYDQADYGEAKPRHVITARHPSSDKPVGRLEWYGKTHRVSNVDVEPEHARRGLATAMWNMGQEIKPRPKHSGDRTAMGDAWAKSVGGSLPRRKRDGA